LFAFVVCSVAIAADQVYYIPIFDFDVNLLKTDLKLMLEHYENGQWVPYNATEDEWAEIKKRGDQTYRKSTIMDFYRQSSDEEGDDTFPEQVKRALEDPSSNLGSGFPFWRQHVLNAVPFHVITARAHHPRNLQKGFEIFAEWAVPIETLPDKFFPNFRSFAAPLYGYDLRDGWYGELFRVPRNAFEAYLNMGTYTAVSEPVFLARHDCDSTEECKADVLSEIVTFSHAFPENAPVVVSFFDDDKNNVNAVMRRMKEQLGPQYPSFCFRIYDTSDRSQAKQIDITDPCKNIEPGLDWQARSFQKLFNPKFIALYKH